MPQIASNAVIEGSKDKPIILDIYTPAEEGIFPLVLFSHGYKGFKDWGAFSDAAQVIAASGFLFVKFNYSHNGGTIEQPIDFPDLESFGHNNFSLELNDLDKVINWATSQYFPAHYQWDGENIFLIGHSRGGGLSILKTAEDPRINKLVAWAAPADFATRFPGNIEEWRKSGVGYIENQRTGQMMPHYFQFYQDYLDNKARIDIPSNAKKINTPTLLCQGTIDDTVLFDEALSLNKWIKDSELMVIENADHSFGVQHPHEGKIPEHFAQVINRTISFLKV